MYRSTTSDMTLPAGAGTLLLWDKDAIRDVVLRYCHAMDRWDQEVLETVFWPDAALDYGMFNGKAAEFVQSIFSWRKANGLAATSHLVGNCLVRVSGGEAFAESYFQAFHRTANSSGGENESFMAGRYQDAFASREGEWRISRRKVIFDWFRHFDDASDWSTGSLGINRKSAHIGDAQEPRWHQLRSLLLT